MDVQRILYVLVHWLFFSLQLVVVGGYLCLTGHDAPSTLDITRVVECGPHELCFLEEYVTPSGYVRYHATCRDANQCSGSSIHNHDILACLECCHGDLCNVNLCGQAAYRSDLGHVCYSCPYGLSTPDQCDTIVQCGRDEVCSSYMDSQGKYRLGCSSQGTCHHASLTSPCATCCNTTLCNTNCTATGATTTSQLDCKAIQSTLPASQLANGVYTARIGGQPMSVWCDMLTDGGGWTLLMKRENGDLDFLHKSLNEYARGFGDVRGNYWIGLDKMHELTSDTRNHELLVELTTANGDVYSETYDDFRIGPPTKFVLYVGHANGSAGDSLGGHSGFGFSTLQVDHDANSENCAKYMQGSWWFNDCFESCLTCPYMPPGSNNCRSMSWNSLAYCTALKAARMLTRPTT